MSRRPKPKRGKATRQELPDRRNFAQRFLRGVLLWLVPVIVVWAVLTPAYNRFLTEATENLVRLTERPSVTRLAMSDPHRFVIRRADYATDRPFLGSVRVTDTHFPLIMLGAFFLAVPGVAMKKRLENLGWAALISIFFHIVALFFWVKFVYATQLEEWSLRNYGVFGRNFWGLGKHLIDLPLKFALPLALWAAFYLRRLLPGDLAGSGPGKE